MNNLSEDVFNKIMLYNSHPVSDLFKKVFFLELSEHYRIHKEGPGYEPNWSEDDDWLFAYQYFFGCYQIIIKSIKCGNYMLNNLRGNIFNYTFIIINLFTFKSIIFG